MAKIDPEKIILVAFFAIMIFLGPGTFFDHKTSHDFPFAYGASDTFQHQVRAEAIKDAGNFRLEADYISKGFENAIGRYPPVIYHLAVILSYAAGIEVYDSIYFTVMFFPIIASLVLYFIIRKLNKKIAVLSMPLSLLIFSMPLSTGFLWGHWPSILSQSFLILFFWSISRMDLDKSPLLIALSFSAVTLTHTSESVFALVFLFIFFGLKFFVKGITKRDIKQVLSFLVIFLVISAYYLVIFKNTWAKAQPYSFSIDPIWIGNPGFYIAGFGLLLIPIILGIVLFLAKLKDLHVSLLLAFSMLIGGFLNYVGFGVRSFQIRFFWPIYLSAFFGFGLYMLLKFIVKKNFAYTGAVFIIFIVLLSGAINFSPIKRTDAQVIPSIPYFNGAASQGIMDGLHWEALDWISKNTDRDSKIYFFYGDIYNQDALLRNSKRVHHLIDPNDFIKALQERKIRRDYISEFPGDGGGIITARTGFFAFEDLIKPKPKEFSFGPRDICTFDYLIFDRASRQPVLAQYNLLIANDLLENDFISRTGVDCIEERTF